MKQMIKYKIEMEDHLKKDLIPFWENLKDTENGGFYGYVSNDLCVDKKAVKGCILHSRILWFFSNAYLTLRDEELLADAKHAYDFIRRYCIDKKNGGIYWSVSYDGRPEETTKHTYNHAFAIYALSSYYQASGDAEALELAYTLEKTIEDKMKDSAGYMEAFDESFVEITNENLSEKRVLAGKTMNTWLHVIEAYTELYRVDHSPKVRKLLLELLDMMESKIYQKEERRLGVFFDADWNSLIDLHSYGHDIEASWLIDRTLDILQEENYSDRIHPITDTLAHHILQTAYDGTSVANESENGVVNEWRIWWVQAESIVGFVNAYEHSGEEAYLAAAMHIWEFIKQKQIRVKETETSPTEWYWEVDLDGKPDNTRELAGPWKCPYHNGRMCFEMINRIKA